MREILFRGKCVDSGEWVFGYYTELPEGDIDGTLMADANELLCEDTADYIISIETKQCPSFSPAYPIQVFDADWCKVRHQTVGQYTGIKDKNGKKIFDGDIMVFCKGATHPFEIKWDGLGWKMFTADGKRIKDSFESGEIQHMQKSEVIGNKWDNPELLEVKK